MVEHAQSGKRAKPKPETKKAEPQPRLSLIFAENRAYFGAITISI
jgi:hypothetical protein